jgi:fatty-acyl-CoA synthase
MTTTPTAPEVPVTPTPEAARVRRQSLGELPHRTALRTPDKVALIAPGAADDGADVRLTYAQLDATIDGVAAAIHEAGLGKGDRLLLLSHNSWQYAVLAFATARVGVVLVPVNFMLGAPDIAYIVEHCGCAAVVVEDALVPVMEDALARAAHEVRVRVAIGDALPDGADGWTAGSTWFEHRGTPPEVDVADDDPIRIMYTSGTESRPKGAVHTSRSLLWQYVSCIVDAGMDADDIEVCGLPLYHCAQLDVFLIPDLYLGATAIIVRDPSPATVLGAIERYGATKFFAPPTVWISFLNSPELHSRDLSTFRKGYYGASPMPVEVLRRLLAELPDVQLRNMYGQTELAPLATMLPPHEQLAFPASAGRPVLNVVTAIVDDDDQPLPAGEVGEIVHRSPHAFLGYLHDEERTAEAFRGGWFHSGDLGYLDENGLLFVVDRKKDMIKTGGENVASREVEEALYAMEGVAEVAVIGLAHEKWVEAVTAVVVPTAGSDITPEQVMDFGRDALASFKRPKYVVLRESLPKNPSGKILKRQLRDEYAGITAEG